MKILRVIFVFIIVLSFAMCGTTRVYAAATDVVEKSEKEMRAYANENDTWVICYQQGIRTSNFYQYDATSEYIYFSYSKHDCVDVYDTNGTYLYSFLFPERQNGSVSVRCENEQVYIGTKDNILYIFAGVEEVERMNGDTAKEKGFDFFWFYDNEPHITVDQKWISWHDDSGEVVRQITVPIVIRETIPPHGEMMAAVPIAVLAVVLFVLLIGVIRKIASKICR